MSELLHAELTYRLRGLAFRIHNELRGGHEEAVYETAVAYALEAEAIPFQEQPVHRIDYRGQQVGEYRPDFMLEGGKLLLELKAAPVIQPLYKAQTISYLGVTHAELGLIMNFGATSMQFERVPNFLGNRIVEATAPPISESVGLLFPELCNSVINAMTHVQFTLGPGFLHQVYRRAARIELAHRDFRFDYLKQLPLFFNGHLITMTPSRVLLINNKLLLATVALRTISSKETERMRWAMDVTKTQLGMIVNFFGTKLNVHFVRAGDTTTDAEKNG